MAASIDTTPPVSKKPLASFGKAGRLSGTLTGTRASFGPTMVSTALCALAGTLAQSTLTVTRCSPVTLPFAWLGTTHGWFDSIR